MDTGPRSSREPAAPAQGDTLDAKEIAELTRRLVKGDEAAYRTFYDAYFNRLSRYLLVVTAGDEHAAREALQGTLIRVVKYVKVFSTEEVFWSWLTVLARSALADNRRSQTRYLMLLDRFRHQSDAWSTATADDDDEHLTQLLEDKVQSLTAKERLLIEQRYFQKVPVALIAEQLGASEKAIESSLSRIRHKLKEAVLSELKNESRS